MSIGPSIPEIQHFENLTLKIQDQGQMTMMLHNYRSRQLHRTSNSINTSSGFRDMVSAKSGPSAAWFDKFLAHRTLNGENPSSGYRDMGSASLAAARLPAWTVKTIPLQPEGLRGKKISLLLGHQIINSCAWNMMISLQENTFCINGTLSRESTGHWWIPP